VLRKERLNVTELTGILGLAQSGVSRHLGLLKDAGLVVEEKDAGYTYYQVPRALPRTPPAPCGLRSRSSSSRVSEAASGRTRRDCRKFCGLRKENFDYAPWCGYP
jgi:DNA-binding transcriptional ArsR family regulator